MRVSVSPAADRQLKTMVRDCLFGLHRCWQVGRRIKGVVEHSLSLRAVDDLTQSALAVYRLGSEGLPEPMRRELRYMLDTAIKNLYVDQRQRGQTFAQRVAYHRQHLGGDALSHLHGVDLGAFGDAVRRSFVTAVHEVHTSLGASEPPAWQTLGRRLARLEAGENPRFRTAREAAAMNEQAFTVFECVLVLVLHALGLRLAGEVFVSHLDLQPEWGFHRSTYLDRFSEYFDYRPERRTAL